MASKINGYRYPGLNDPANVPNDLQALASDVSRKLARTFPTVTERAAAAGAASGDRSYTAGDKSDATYIEGTGWVGADSAPVGYASWVVTPLSSGWLNYSSIDGNYEDVGYMRLNGVVWLKGLMRAGAPGAIIFTLPAGFRPATRMGFDQLAADGIARVDVESNGTVSVQAYSPSGYNAYVSLELSFPADL